MKQSSGYEAVYESWRADPEGWWGRAAGSIDWDRRWDTMFDVEAGPYGFTRRFSPA